MLTEWRKISLELAKEICWEQGQLFIIFSGFHLLDYFTLVDLPSELYIEAWANLAWTIGY